MAQTPTSSATPYCTAARLVQFFDWQMIADLLRDGAGPRPSRRTILDPDTTEGAILEQKLLAGSGMFEAAVFAGKRYTAADLAALTGNSLAYAETICAALTMWELMQRRQPGSADPDTIPGVKNAIDTLKQLRKGELIFALLETQQAGLPDYNEPPVQPRTGSVVGKAGRMFGTHYGQG